MTFIIETRPGATETEKKGAELYRLALEATAAANPTFTREQVIAATSRNITTTEN